jgi:hypothetical protein
MDFDRLEDVDHARQFDEGKQHRFGQGQRDLKDGSGQARYRGSAIVRRVLRQPVGTLRRYVEAVAVRHSIPQVVDQLKKGRMVEVAMRR